MSSTTNKNMHKKTLQNIALSSLAAAVLTACGGGGSCANCTTPGPNGGQLIFVAPSILPSLANKSGINYMGVYNPSEVTISGISYSMGQQVGSGNSITMDQTSAVNCASIAAKSSCFLKFSVPESTIAGGTVVTASNSDGTEAATPLAIGVQQVPYIESANANGVGLYFYPKAQYTANGVPFILVTAVVQSPNVGTINTIELVDESGNVISGQVVTSNNSGPGTSPLQMGDVVEISLPIPQGVGITQNLKVRTSYQTLTTSALNSIADKLNLKNQSLKDSTNSSTGTTTYSLITQSNNINLQFTPNQVYLTQQNSIQYGYLYNIGDLTASQIEVSSSSPNVRVTAADEILNGQRVIKVTYELINTSVAPTTNTVTVTAQNPAGQTQTSTGGTSQNVNPLPVPTPSPSPSPTPTPTPGPGPTPTPSANLTLSSSIVNLTNNGGFYKTITVTNTGNASATNLVLPAITAPLYLYSLNTCVNGQTLAAGASCSYSVAYAGGVSGNTTKQFSYTGGGDPLDLTINWQAAQQYGYLVVSSSIVYKCAFDGSDNISYCLSQGTGIDNSVNSLAFTTAPDGTNYLYITQYSDGVAKCTLDGNGDITNCDINAGAALVNAPNFGEAVYITFGIVNNSKYAYLSDNYGNLWSCSLKNDGDFDTCTQLGVSTANGISFNSINGTPYLYMAGEDNNSTAGVLRFALNPDNGQIIGDSVVQAGDAIYRNGGVNIFSFNGTNYAYSANDSNGGISCTLDADGKYTSTCNTFSGYNTNGVPYNTSVILTQNGNLCAYFGGTNGGSTNGLYRCSINQGTGALNCSLNSAISAYSITFGTYAATTPPVSKHIFVTSGSWNGDLKTAGSGVDGYTGADALCQTAANSGTVTSSIGATWKALLWGNNSTTPEDIYIGTTGNFLTSATGTDLIHYSSSLFSAINYDENGALITSGYGVWTAGFWRTDGYVNCDLWTNSSGSQTGYVGSASSAEYWAADYINGQSQACSAQKRLYCVQQ